MAPIAQNRSTIAVERGLYVLRYVGGEAGRLAPTASVRPVAGDRGDVRVIGPPGRTGDELPGPGSSVVIVSTGPATVEIVIRSFEGSPSLDAQFSLELLSKGEPEPVARPDPVALPDPVARPDPGRFTWGAPVETVSRRTQSSRIEVDVLAHVARRGDVQIGDGEWAAGPSQPAPIEGVQIRCSGGDVSVEAQFNNSRDGRWSSWLPPETFVGTRGQAKPLTGLRLRLVGEDAERFALHAEALFLGSPVLVKRDRLVELASTAGVDPLVGLKLSVKPATPRDEPLPVAQAAPRVRVFRANRAES